jgi:ribose transport system substrate-binding protein
MLNGTDRFSRVALCMLLTLCAAIFVAPVFAQAPLRVGAVMYARDSQYWQQIEKGLKDGAAQAKVDLQVALNRRQLPTEGQVIDDFITRGIDILVISPLDKDASIAAIKRAKDKGILVVEYNTFLSDKTVSQHYVGVDNRELAAAVGREIRRTIDGEFGGSASIGLVTLPPMNPGSVIRKEGLLSALQGEKLNVVAELSGATPEEGANALENILQRDPATQIIWASNSGTLAGAVAAARRKQTKVKLYGIDMSQELAELLLDASSNLQAVSDQQPYRVGFLAVDTAVKAKRGEKMARDVTVPVKVYTKREPQAVKEYIDLIKSLSN